jgi:arylsulfatase A-like enzyme
MVVTMTAALAGVFLPFDFLGQLDGYVKYLRLHEILLAYAHGWIIHAAMGIACAAALLFLQALFVRAAKLGGRWKLPDAGSVALVAISFFVLLRSMRDWLGAVDAQGEWLPRVGALSLGIVAIGAAVLAVRFSPKVVRGLRSFAVASLSAGMTLSACVLSWSGASDLLAAVGRPAQGPADRRVPNIVLVTVDTLSAGHLSTYGYARPTAPSLDWLALRATVFERHYANGNFTTPAMNSMIHGVRPWTHRALHLQARIDRRTASQGLLARLREAGYETLVATTNYSASPRHIASDEWVSKARNGLTNSSWDRVLPVIPAAFPALSTLAVPTTLLRLVDRSLVWAGVWGQSDHFDAALVVDASRDLLSTRDRAKPFFLWLHMFAPHAPYAAPAPFLGRFDPRESARTRLDSTPAGYWPAARGDRGFPDRYVGRYDESVLQVDFQIGRLMQGLVDTGLFEGALVVVSADHGESFGHGFATHGGPMLYEDVIRVPLLIKEPRQSAQRRVAAVTEQVDLLPTILELLQLEARGTLEGKSLVPAMRGKPVDGPAFAMNFEQSSRFGKLDSGSVAMIEGRWKYTHFLGTPRYPGMPGVRDMLHDVVDDASEANDLMPAMPGLADRMREAIQSRLRAHGERRS